MKIKKEIIYESVTGEVLHTSTKQLRMHLFTEKGFAFNNNNRSIKMYPTGDWPNLTHSEVGQLVAISRWLDDGNKIPLSNKQMAAVLELSENRTYLFIGSMIDSGVMKRQGRFLYINPLIFFAGKRMSRELYLLFQESLDPVLPKWVKTKFQEELS